jgi:F420-non-reducing hydrogenase iron-sulfur subunit
MEATRITLDALGLEPDRFAIEWVSSAEAPRFAEVITHFTEKIKTMGPSPLRQARAIAD